MINQERDELFKNMGSDFQEVNLDDVFALLKKAIKEKNQDCLKYQNIISVGAENEGKRLNRKDLTGVLDKIYKIWWDNWLIPNSKIKNHYQSTTIKRCVDEKLYHPDNKDKINIYEIMDELSYSNLFEDACHLQNRYFCVIDTNLLSVKRKKYVRYFYQAKLYLNIKLKNRIELAEKFIDKVMKEDLPLTFKFALDDNRTDNFVLYVNFNEVEKTAKMIEEVKTENPQLFDGCKVCNPLLAKYKGYMGFGEESYIESYNADRSDILVGAYQELEKKFKYNEEDLTDADIKAEFKKQCYRKLIDSKNFSRNKNIYEEDLIEEDSKAEITDDISKQ